MYKVGDKVFIKAEVIEVMNDVPYPVTVRLGSDNGGLVFTNDEVCYADKIVKTYEMGLSDAWQLAEKIDLFDNEKRTKIFGYLTSKYIKEHYNVQEALSKIEAYEKEKEIKVKDIVKYHDCEGVGVVTYVDSEHACVMWKNGRFGEYQKCYLEKTGETAESLDLLLRQIGE